MPDKKNLPKTNDHNAQAEKPKTLTTEFHGVDITVDTAVLNDWRLTDALYDVQSGENFLKAVAVMRMILGSSYGPVIDALESESEDGRVSNEKMAEACQALLKELSPNS